MHRFTRTLSIALLASATCAAQVNIDNRLQTFLDDHYANPAKVGVHQFVVDATAAGLIVNAEHRVAAKRFLRALHAKKTLQRDGRRPIGMPEHELFAPPGAPAAGTTELEFNDTIGDADVLGTGATSIDGRLESGDIDTYHFVLHTAGLLTAAIDPLQPNAVGDPDLLIRDSNGEIVAYSDDAGGTLFPRIDIFLPAGVYYLSTTQVSGRDGDYTLSTAVAPRTPSRLVLGQSTAASLSDPAGANFELIVPQHSTLDLTMTSATLDLAITVLRGDGAFFFFNDDSNGLDPRFLGALPAGRYTVLVTEFNGLTGDFSYRADLTPGISPAPCPGSVTGELTTAGEFHLYQLDLPGPQRVRLETFAGTLSDSVLELYDARLLRVARNDDKDTGLDSRILIDLPAGTWFVAVTGFFGGVGSYRLEGACEAPRRPTPAVVGSQSVILQAGGDTASFSLRVETPGSYRIAADGSGGTVADPVLAALDQDGLGAMFDDDGGIGLNSQADVFLPRGNYTIVVSTYGGGSGTLDLIVDPPLTTDATGTMYGTGKTGDLAALFAAAFPSPPRRVLPGLTDGFLLLDLGSMTLVDSLTVDATGRYAFAAVPPGFGGAVQGMTFLGGGFPARFTNRL